MAQRKVKKKELPYVCAFVALLMIRSGARLFQDTRDGPGLYVLVDDSGRPVRQMEADDFKMLLTSDDVCDSKKVVCYTPTLAARNSFKEVVATSLRRWMESTPWGVHWHNGK